MTEPGRLAGSKESILAYVEELKADCSSARVSLPAMISGAMTAAMNASADAVKAVADYEQRIAKLDEMISHYEAELAAGQ